MTLNDLPPIQEGVVAEMERNAQKYPVELARGSSAKYTELQES